MAAPVLRPCEPWPYEACCDELGTADPVLLASIQTAATEALWALSARRFGLCTHRVRPCRQRCMPLQFAHFSPLHLAGWDAWAPMAVRCGCGPNNCGCTTICQLALPGPVAGITEVVLDGVILDPSAYRVDEFRYLVRIDGECWPACQDFNAESDQPGTWEVTFTQGRPVPNLGERAMGALMCELIKLCVRDASCVLPRNVANITRQGVTINFRGTDSTNALIEFIPEIALFLRVYNPSGLVTQSRIYRADAPPYGRRVGT